MIDDFIKEVDDVAKLYTLKVEILARTKNAVKIVHACQELKNRNFTITKWCLKVHWEVA